MARRNSDKEPMSDDEFDDIWASATDRVYQPYIRRMTRDEIIAKIKQKNGYRWWRIQYDYRWLRRQVKKLGQNPDDARELL